MALLTNINGKFSVSDVGAVTFNNAFTFPTADGAANYVLQTNGSGQLAWALNGNGDISGSGTANTVTKFTGAKTIGNGPITFSSNESTFTGRISVTGDISADNYINIEGATNPYLRIQDITNEEYLNLYSSDNESAIVYTQDTFKISSGVDFLNQTPRLTINSSGNATFTGTVTAPTFLGDLNGTINTVTTATTKGNSTNDTTVATTAFVQNVIGTIPAGLVFQGTWNASTNSPTLTSGSGTTGNFYIVSVAGSTNLDGITDWQVGDWAVFIEQGASDQWEKIDNSSVLSGSGTGGSFAGWSGSGTSVTLGNAPVTFSGNNSTFAGNVFARRGSFGTASNFNFDLYVNGDAYINDALTVDDNATFAGIVGMGSTGIYAGTAAQLNLPGKGLAIKNDKNGSGNNWSYIENTATGSASNINFYTGNNAAALTLAHNGNATFAGDVISNAIVQANGFRTTTGSTDYSLLTRNSSNTAVYIQQAGSGNILDVRYGSQAAGQGTSAFAVNSSGNATFAGNITSTATSFVQTFNVTDNSTFFNINHVGNEAWLFKCESIGGGAADFITIGASGGGKVAFGEDGGAIFEGSIGVGGAPTAGYNIDSIQDNAGYSIVGRHSSGGKVGIYSSTGDNGIGTINNYSMNFFTNNSGPQVTLTTAGNLGIGTTSPSRKLVVAQSNVTEPSGIDANASILIKNNTWSGIQMLATEATGNFITFGDNVNGFAGRIQYSHATNAMQFETVGTERMRIDSSGVINFSKTATTATPVASINHASNDFVYFSGGAGGGSFGDDSHSTRMIAFDGDYLRFDTNGAERMRIDSSGAVLIGDGVAKIDSTTKLQVSASDSGITSVWSNADDIVFENNNNFGITLATPNTGAATIAFADPEAVNEGYIQYVHGDDYMRFATNQLERMRIDSSGNVLINSGVYLSWGTNGASSIEGSTVSNKLQFRTNSANAMIIDSSQRVGIGIDSPDVKLHVNGGTSNVPLLLESTDNKVYISFKDNDTTSTPLVGGDDNDLIFATSDAERMRIKSNGKVGIGTENAQNAELAIKSGSNVDLELFSEASGTAWQSYNRTSSSWGYIRFIAGGGEQMRIHTNGNVGIGTTSPVNKLNVNGDIGFTGFLGQGSIFGNSGNSSYAEMQLYNPATGYTTIDNKAYGYYFATAGSTKLTILNNGNVGIGNTSPQTTLHVGTTTTVTNQFTNQVNASNFFVNGNANGGASFFQCKTAAVNINMMGNNDFACNQFTFYHKPLSTSQNVVGTIATFSSSTQYNTTSDYRLKENVIPLSDSIIRLKQLKPSRFNFIEDPERTMDGFLAHEVQNTVPEAVNGEKDAVDENGNEVHQGIDQAKIVPLLVAAVQEQQEIIESLKQRIEQLEN